MSNRKRRVGANSRQIDVRAMREAARDFLGWTDLTTEAAADFLDINKRTWLRYESKEKHIADSQIKLFWFEVALTKLEQIEAENPANLKIVLGGDFTIERVYDFCHTAWEDWDPVFRKANNNKENT